MDDPRGTIDRVLAAARRRLRSGGSAEARLDAERLLSHALGRERAWLIAHGDATLTAAQATRYANDLARRLAGEPVAYIMGSVGFYGHEFAVSPDVLVPRPESEHVVEAAIADLRARLVRAERVRLCDVGTGSGALAIACALGVPQAEAVGVDASLPAVGVASRNAASLGVADRCRFFAGDLFAPAAESGPYDVVLANLPYIPSAEVPRRPDPVGFEPVLALDGGPDGLDLYRRLVDQLAEALARGVIAAGTAGGRAPTSLFFEAAPVTMDGLATLVERAFPSAFVEVGEDYAGLERYIAATL